MGRAKMFLLLTFGAVGFVILCVHKKRPAITLNESNNFGYAKSKNTVDLSSDIQKRRKENLGYKSLKRVCNRINLVVFFPLMLSDSSRNIGYDFANVEALLAREREYIETLSNNLSHQAVCKVYLLSSEPEHLLEVIQEKYKLKTDKLEIRMVSGINPTYAEIFSFVSDHLTNELVFILNADNILGEGFEQLTATSWRHSKTMYALTRHSSPRCKLGPEGYCDDDGYYHDSHDGFLFYVNGKLPDSFINQLYFPSNQLGSENVIIWAFRNVLNYTVRNPCKKMFVYHNHCSNVRPVNIRRYFVDGGKKGRAFFE